MSFKRIHLNTGIRMGSMLLDHVIMGLVAITFFLPDFVRAFSGFFDLYHEPSSSWNMIPGLSPVAVIGFAIYFAKDSIQGRSPAKRVLRLQVVKAETNQAASPLRCMIRNMTIVIWPVEVVVALFNPERRLGDYIAGTELVRYEPELHQTSFKWPYLIPALVLSYGFNLMIFYTLYIPLEMRSDEPVPYVETSKNALRSDKLANLLEEELGPNFEADVAIYDETLEDPELMYISVILRMSRNYIDNDFEPLNEQVKALVYAEYAKGSFTGQVKYYYEGRGNRQMTTIRF